MSTPQFDPLTVRLLEQLQTQVPLVERPFAEIARRLELKETDVLDRLQALRAPRTGVIRQISAIFDSRLLGYQSSLVAVKVNPEKIDAAAAQISQHPGVSHNYRRDHAYNLWYTIAVGPDSRPGLERSVEILHECSGAIASRLMPALKMYKIGVKFDLSEVSEVAVQESVSTAKPAASPVVVTEKMRKLVRVLQKDLPGEPRPFDAWATEAGTTVADLLSAAAVFRDSGVMRRFSAVLRHRAAGYTANAMGVWAVLDDQCDRFGEIAAGFKAVSHCYRRPTYEDWPYSLYTMVHAPTPQAAQAVLASISTATGCTNYTALFSTHEYKKTRVQYFAPDIEQWERTIP
jgi:siroheme decarboxylase